MPLTEKEKERIIEEEKVRFEAKNQLWKESYGGRCGSYGWGHSRKGFWKGLLTGLILAWIVSAWCRHSGWSCPYGQGGYGMMGKSCNHGMMWDKSEAPSEMPAPPAEKK